MALRPSAGKPNASSYRPIEEILDSPEHLDATFDGPAAANVPDLIAGRVEQSPECSQSRFDVEVVSAPSATEPGGQRSVTRRQIERPLVAGAPQQRIPRLERRWGSQEIVHRQNVGIEERIADARLQIDRACAAMKRGARLQSLGPRIGDVVGPIPARSVEGTGGDDQIVERAVEERRLQQDAPAHERLIDASLHAFAAFRLERWIVGECNLERTRRPDARARGSPQLGCRRCAPARGSRRPQPADWPRQPNLRRRVGEG